MKAIKKNIKSELTSISAFAPASIGNVIVGFDVLGLSMSEIGDIVTVSKLDSLSQAQAQAHAYVKSQTQTQSRSRSRLQQQSIFIESITGIVTDLPRDYRLNTATAAIAALIKPLKLNYSLSVKIEKNIPLGSGLGGSASSAVAGVVAANALLGNPYSLSDLFYFALEGERVASGAAHPDNVAPSLYGGLVMASTQFGKAVQNIPLPKGVYGVVVHPDIEVQTKEARKILKSEIALADYVKQSALLAGFILACTQNDFNLLSDSLKDLLIEPQRSHLIPGFKAIKAKLLKNSNCLGFSISGSGPSVFSLVRDRKNARHIAEIIKQQFIEKKINSQAYVFKLSSKGAHVWS